LLHDTIEDIYVPQSVLAGLFGHLIYDEILMLSKEIPSFHPVTGVFKEAARRDKYIVETEALVADDRAHRCLHSRSD
jgi:hypothetical protein